MTSEQVSRGTPVRRARRWRGRATLAAVIASASVMSLVSGTAYAEPRAAAGTPEPPVTAAGPPAQQSAVQDKVARSATREGQSYSRFLVHFTADSTAADRDDAAGLEVAAVARATGRSLDVQRRLGTGGAVVRTAQAADKAQADRIMETFARRASVDFVEPDLLVEATATPNDPQLPAQWHYSEARAGLNLPGAWDLTTSARTVVAVLDTGVATHADLSPRLVPGYDFVSDLTRAGDGNARDASAADPGDWCAASPDPRSSWHGTHVAGTVGATGNNGIGVSGAVWNARIQPVRVLGRCGGDLSDIVDAIVWASGGSVPGIPVNATPARVLNLSLGTSSPCAVSGSFQRAIDSAVSRGSAVVVAAGNDNADAAGSSPASCSKTITVSASDREGNRARYSNFGASIDVTAPGGETDIGANGVLSTYNTGITTPGTESYQYLQGTSMAAPHVAGVAALILSRRNLTPAQLEEALRRGVRALPGTCPGGCGTGLLDASFAIRRLNRAPVVGTLSPTSGAIVGDLTPTLTANASDADGDPVQLSYRLTGPGVDLSSGWVTGSWTVPAHRLDPGTAYTWTVTARDRLLAASATKSAVLRTAVLPTAAEVVSLSTGDGYWQVAADGGVFSYGRAQFHGSVPGLGIAVNNIIGMARTPTDDGYWLVGRDGGVFSFGGAPFKGSLPALGIRVDNIVGMAATKDGQGYWLVGSDGGVFAFGSAGFHGSMGGQRLNKPVEAIAPTTSSQGYWLVAQDGGVFSFGDAPFYGSMGSQVLNAPVVDLDVAPDGAGYYMTAEDGGVFTFGSARFFGSLAGRPLNGRITSMALTADGGGYWLNACDGGIFTFGNAPFYGSNPTYACRGT